MKRMLLTAVLAMLFLAGCWKLTPPTNPQPTPGALPFPGDGLRVLIVYESADLSGYLETQKEAMFGGEVRSYLNAKCATGEDGKGKDWRVLDKDTDLSQVPPMWTSAMARGQRSLPWIVIGNGKVGYEGPLPGNVADTLALLRKFGG